MGSDSFSVGSVILGGVLAVGTYFIYKKYIKDANKSDFEKAVDKAAGKAKTSYKSAEDSVNSYRNDSPKDKSAEVLDTLKDFGSDMKDAAGKLGEDLRRAAED